MGLILMVVGAVVILVGAGFFFIAAFSEGFLWGMACLFLPFASLVFLVMYWQEAKRGFWIQMVGLLIVVVGAILMPDALLARELRR